MEPGRKQGIFRRGKGRRQSLKTTGRLYSFFFLVAATTVAEATVSTAEDQRQDALQNGDANDGIYQFTGTTTAFAADCATAARAIIIAITVAIAVAGAVVITIIRATTGANTRDLWLAPALILNRLRGHFRYIIASSRRRGIRGGCITGRSGRRVSGNGRGIGRGIRSYRIAHLTRSVHYFPSFFQWISSLNRR